MKYYGKQPRSNRKQKISKSHKQPNIKHILIHQYKVLKNIISKYNQLKHQYNTLSSKYQHVQHQLSDAHKIMAQQQRTLHLQNEDINKLTIQIANADYNACNVDKNTNQ